MLVTSTQVSWAFSAAIVLFFTVALFLSGYILQRQTVESLREAIPDIPNKQILAAAARGANVNGDASIPVPIVENPRFAHNKDSNGEAQGVLRAKDDEEGVNVEVLEVGNEDVAPRKRGSRTTGKQKITGDDIREMERQRAPGGQQRNSRTGNGGSVGAAAMRAQRQAPNAGGSSSQQRVTNAEDRKKDEVARMRKERERVQQIAKHMDANDALVQAGLDEFSIGRGHAQSGPRMQEGSGIGKKHDKYEARKSNHYEDHGPFSAGDTLISIREDGVHAIDMREQRKERQRGLR